MFECIPPGFLITVLVLLGWALARVYWPVLGEWLGFDDHVQG